jgi:hypothetical protein
MQYNFVYYCDTYLAVVQHVLHCNGQGGVVAQNHHAERVSYEDDLEPGALHLAGLSYVVCICGYVDMWICGYVDMWICGYVDMWICRYVDMWICGYVDI